VTDNLGEPAKPVGEATAPAGEVTLAGLLNVLWRQRVVALLLPLCGLVGGVVYVLVAPRMYEAKASIRPGITAYTPDGGPVREWRLKDITQWYDDLLYRQGVVERLGLRPRARPVIKADFIAQGLQNLQGGDVITLTTFARDPVLARHILDASIEIFAEYAVSDTVSSGVKLTRDGLQIRVQRLRNQIEALDREAKGLDLKLAAALAESLQIESEVGRIELQIDDRKLRRANFGRNVTSLQDQRERLTNNLAELDRAIAWLKDDKAETGSEAPIPAWLDRDAVLSGPDVLGTLIQTRARLEADLLANAVLADSLQTEIERTGIAIDELKLKKDRDVAARRLAAHEKIGDLRLEKQYGLPIKAAELRMQIREAEVQLAQLSPIEQIGRITVSEEPVRPRKLRAILILTVLGGLAGLVAAFAWDFVWKHRAEIFRS
jgi:hypothetical protein